MSDPRLNSIHLELPRRRDFRAARELLLNSCGSHTLCAEAGSDLAGPGPGLCGADKTHGDISLDAKFVLMDADHVYPLKVGLNTIGRMPDNDVVLEDAYVSRRHCAVLVHHDSDACELHDVASKNGTLLNGRKITGPTPLKSGDEIGMCNKHLVFVSRQADPAHAYTMPTRTQ
jgi:hypothetical protein